MAHASYELTQYFLNQGQFSDPTFNSGIHQGEKVQFANKGKICKQTGNSDILLI